MNIYSYESLADEVASGTVYVADLDEGSPYKVRSSLPVFGVFESAETHNDSSSVPVALIRHVGGRGAYSPRSVNDRFNVLDEYGFPLPDRSQAFCANMSRWTNHPLGHATTVAPYMIVGVVEPANSIGFADETQTIPVFTKNKFY